MSDNEHLNYARSKIADVPDFPKPGILFKDITPLLQDKKAFNDAVDDLASHLNGANKVAGIESRGFIFAAAIAAKHNLGLVLLRKPGKLPRKTHVVQYQLEYGFDSLEMHQDSLDKNDRVLLVDDVLATGGTMMAGCELIAKSGAKLTNCAVFIEISALNGRNRLSSIPIHSSIIV
ncbi:MAG: adenine phosphoribosyltransferase [Actinomycetota bacterium]|nr:adenine phosphoribosyltransferase [Actinomycetota bacterium]MDA3026381.1 adenine phosphoribosyltransferase [Actinomycetota bacterium]